MSIFQFFCGNGDDPEPINIGQLLTEINRKVDIMAGENQAIRDAIASLNAKTEAEKAQVAAKLDDLSSHITDLTAQVTALQDKIKQGTDITAADAADIVAGLNAAQTKVDDISGDVAPAATPPAASGQ